MFDIRRIFAVVALMVSLGVLNANAQTGAFKKEWTKIYDNVYFRNLTPVDKKPNGKTDFRVFGFRDKNEYPANIEVSGNVTETRKADKSFRYVIDGGTVSVAYDDVTVKYDGKLELTVAETGFDVVMMGITPLDGNWKVGDTKSGTFTSYHIKPGWHEHTGSLTLSVGKPGKADPTPPFSVDYSDFMLPKHVVKKADFTREISSLLQAGSLPVTKNDSLLLNSVVTPGSRIENVPDLRMVVSEMRMKNDTTRVADSEVLCYMLGDKLELSDADITVSGIDYLINYHGLVPEHRFKAVYHNSAFPEFTSVVWEDGKNKFEDDDLTRADGSRITRIKFDVKDNLLEMPKGYIMSQARALGDFTRLDMFDFNKYYGDENIGTLSVGGYISPDNKATLVNEGVIEPVRDRVQADRERVRKVVSQGQERYDKAKAWLEARQKQLATEYETFADGQEVFEMSASLDGTPHTVKVIRQIKLNMDDGGYTESFYVNDDGVVFPIEIDGEACVANSRTYSFSLLVDKARTYLENYRMGLQHKDVVKKGRPNMPKFD